MEIKVNSKNTHSISQEGRNKKFYKQYWRQIFHKKHCSIAAGPSSQSKHKDMFYSASILWS